MKVLSKQIFNLRLLTPEAIVLREMVTLLMNFSDVNGITMLLLRLGYVIFSERSRQCKSNLFSSLLRGRTSVWCYDILFWHDSVYDQKLWKHQV